jgi:dissimilatory sulfite reductase (desulfoviridin) alpha/beta subunit
MRGLVSCTGSQFCPVALIETKNRAMEVVRKLEAELDIPRLVRIHWTGCPNSCAQAQVHGDWGGAEMRVVGRYGGRLGDWGEDMRSYEELCGCTLSFLHLAAHMRRPPPNPHSTPPGHRWATLG